MHVLSSAPPGSAWTFGASILTFVFPELLFVLVACTLYVLYTKPELIPGHQIDERPVSYTPLPGQPTATAGEASGAAGASEGTGATAGDGAGATASDAADPESDEAATPEDRE
ncbi:MAG TPA: hypothetical protein VIY52_02400 [Streptosporangiaceae bacterium]